VTNFNSNVTDLEGIKVSVIDNFSLYRENALVLITPSFTLKDKIIDNLNRLNFKDYKWIDLHMCEVDYSEFEC
jgi:hypothetical protein